MTAALMLLVPLGNLLLLAGEAYVPNKTLLISTSSRPGQAVLVQPAIQQRLQAALERIGSVERAAGDWGISKRYHWMRRPW
jgi:hypothetical protein